MTYRIAPGSTVTSAAAIVFEILNVVESTILTEPPESLVGFTWEKEKEKGLSTVPCGSFGASAVSGGSSQSKNKSRYSKMADSLAGKMYNSSAGIVLNTSGSLSVSQNR